MDGRRDREEKEKKTEGKRRIAEDKKKERKKGRNKERSSSEKDGKISKGKHQILPGR